MKNLTESKRSTESDTGTEKNNRWFRIGAPRHEIEHVLDLYWGGKERRITGLTLRIIGVNFLALISLILGVVYLGQYHATLIESKLKGFQTEVLLVTAAIAKGATGDISEADDNTALSPVRVETLSAHLGATLNKRILIFDADSRVIADSEALIRQYGINPVFQVSQEKQHTLDSIRILKNTVRWVSLILPRYQKLRPFPDIDLDHIEGSPDFWDAKQGYFSISAWYDSSGEIILTAAMPILKQSNIVGVVMLISKDERINEALGDMWFNILKIFLVTLLITILLSIYLSGTIAKPLRQLARVAENVRNGKATHTDIPDMSDRYDEIGELSLVLRDMTHALWDRMDTIESFAADVSHEIKNPLTSLKSAVETASIITKKKDLDKLLSVIKHDVDRLDRLITDISSASRLDAELSREVFEVIDLKEVLKQLLDSYKNPLERKAKNQTDSDQVVKDGIMITLDLPDYLNVYVLGRESRLIQVFQNILSNAFSFAPVKTTIRITMAVREHKVIVSVEDEGPGIPENQLQNIFERFYSERPEHEEYGRHSGLGLSICKQIIAAHNGRIYAENRKDRSGNIVGARFVVVLDTARREIKK